MKTQKNQTSLFIFICVSLKFPFKNAIIAINFLYMCSFWLWPHQFLDLLKKNIFSDIRKNCKEIKTKIF